MSAPETPSLPWWRIAGPGLLVAATGVGAGDLATASFAGMHLGVAVLWAVLLGAFLKYVLTEGLARYQLATGDTLIEGAILRLGKPFVAVFMVYFLLWSFVVGGALVSACGAATHALFPFMDDADVAKRIFGVVHSALGVGLVLLGGYRLFEVVMRVCIGIMFFCVVVTALRVGADGGAVLQGFFLPSVASFTGDGLRWTIALMGGVGGTLTILCYGYWIREEERSGIAWLGPCRIDLALGYIVTAVFGCAMVVIGSRITGQGSGAGLIVALGAALEENVGMGARYLFLIGAYGAIFSSLLGVWQCVPLIFADVCSITLRGAGHDPVNEKGIPYRAYLVALAAAACVSLFVKFETIQLIYGVIGALFMPMLAALLLYLNGPALPLASARNRPATIAALAGCILFFAVAAYFDLRARFM